MTQIYVGSFQPQFRSSLSVDADVQGKGNGIYLYRWDEELGELTPCGNVYAAVNPARFCHQPANGKVYAASDTNEFLNWEAGSGGGLYAYDAVADGMLKLADSRSSCGVRAVDLCCDDEGKYVVCINEGTDFCTTEFVRNEQGRYVADIRRDEGCAVLIRTGGKGFAGVCDRYVLPEGAPAHPVRICRDAEGYLYIANRGGRAISVLRLDSENGKLLPVATVPLSDEPQGLALHPTLPMLYVSCPEHGEILALHFDPLRRLSTLSLRVFEEEPSHPGVLTMACDGRTLYCADTETGEIKVYGMTDTGNPVLLQRTAIGGDVSQAHQIYDMRLTPSGRWLFCTDLIGDALWAFPVEQGGRLGCGKAFPSPTPTGLLLL